MQRRAVLGGIALAAGALLTGAGAGIAAPVARRHVVEDLAVFRYTVNRRGDWIVVRLHASGGLTGLGDASHGGHDDETVRYLRRFLDLLRGRSIFDIEWFAQAVAGQLGATRAPQAYVAASALEQCLWDLAGQALGVPTYDLFGGRVQSRIPLYANINRSTDPRTPEGFARMAGAAIDDGFDAIKLAPFDEMPAGLTDRAAIERFTREGIACARAVRDAIGPSRKLLIDAHSHFGLADGIELARRLQPLDLYWLEEVTPADPVADLAAINRSAPMPTAGGEAIHGVVGFYPYITAEAVDIVMPDVKICGGMLELRKIAAIAEGAGLSVSPHGPASPVGTLAAAHVAATLPNFTILEHAYGEVPWRAELLDPPERIDRSSLTLGDAAGFGISLNERSAAKYAKRL